VTFWSDYAGSSKALNTKTTSTLKTFSAEYSLLSALGVRFNWTHVSLSNGREAQHTSKKVKR
jgi:hypothetical protein